MKSDQHKSPAVKRCLIASLFMVIAALGSWAWHRIEHYNMQWDLTAAAGSGDLARLEYLLSRGADINMTPVNWDGGGNGYPPLLFAVLNQQEAIVDYLLDHGARTEVGVVDTPLLIACLEDNYVLTASLLKHGANPNVRGEGTPLLAAIDHGDIRIVELLLRYRADPNMALSAGLTPASTAQGGGNMQIIKILQFYGAVK